MTIRLGVARPYEVAPLMLIVALTANVPANAQDGSGLETVLVTAQRREENAQEVPISVVVMDERALSNSQVNSLGDLPQVAPSLNFENRGAGAAISFSMRGVGAFAPSLSVQPGVGLVVDEIPYSRNVEYDVDLGAVSSVQFLNGPQGTLFGANNIGGVVLISTADPSTAFEGSVEGTVTSDDELIMRGTVSGALTDRISARLSVFNKDREGYLTNLYPLADSGGPERRGAEESQGARLKVKIDVADNVTLRLLADYRDTYNTEASQVVDVAGSASLTALQGGGDPVLGQRVIDDPKLINTDIPTYNSIETWGVGANLTWELTDSITLKSITGYRQTTIFGINDVDVSPATAGDLQDAVVVSVLRSNRGIHPEDDGKISYNGGGNFVENYKQELRFEYSSEMFDAVVGGFYLSDDNRRPDGLGEGALGGNLLVRNGPAPTLQYFNLLDNKTELDAWAIFTDVTWHIGDTLDVFAGYRWTEETLGFSYFGRTLPVGAGQWTVVGDTVYVDPAVVGTITAFDADYDTGEWAGRAGLMWRMTPDINLYGSVSRGFTGAGVVGAATSPADAFVAPTTALSYEVGIKSTLLDNRLRMNVAVFRNELEDIQAALFDTIRVQNILVNAGDFRSQGVELDLTAALGDRLTVTANVTLMETELTEDVYEPCYLGQTVAQGCVSVGATARAQNVKGKPGINAPDLKYSLGALYDVPFASMPFDGRAGLSYNWTDERYYELIFDPIASYAPSYGTLDMNFTLVDKQGRYEVSLFGKNVLDENFITYAQTEATRNGRARANYTRGSFAYWGVRASLKF